MLLLAYIIFFTVLVSVIVRTDERVCALLTCYGYISRGRADLGNHRRRLALGLLALAVSVCASKLAR